MALIDNRSHGKNTGAVHTERVQYKDWSFDYILERILVEFGFRFVKQSFRARSECGPEVVIYIVEVDHRIAKPHLTFRSKNHPAFLWVHPTKP